MTLFVPIVVNVMLVVAATANRNNPSKNERKIHKSMDIFKIYKRLHEIYGPQGWWPKHAEAAETDFSDPYFEIALGAILTQNTAWKNVAKVISSLYQAKSLKPELILKLNTRKLQNLIRPAGYYKQKAKKLKIFCHWLVENYNSDTSKLKKHQIGPLRIKLLNIWGIGKETADSIILYALNKPIFVIDEYTRRLCRIFGISFKEYDDYRHFFEQNLRRHKSTKLFQEYHALIVASGKDKHKNISICKN